MTITPEQLDELEAVARAATPGPWADPMQDDWPESESDILLDLLFDRRTGETNCDKADAAHIAAFDPVTALALVARVRELEAEVMRLRTTNRELNRRATQAEAACRVTVEDCRREGVSLGRSLANAGYAALEAEIERLRGLVYGDGDYV